MEGYQHQKLEFQQKLDKCEGEITKLKADMALHNAEVWKPIAMIQATLMELKDKFLELKEGHAQKLLNVESVLKAENVQLREQLIHLEQKVQEIINYKQSEIAKPIGNSKRQEKERESTIQKQEKADRSGKRKSYESVDNIESEHIHQKTTKMPRIQMPPPAVPSAGQNRNNSSNLMQPIMETSNDSLLQMPSIVRQALQGGGSQTELISQQQTKASTANGSAPTHDKKTSSNNIEQKRHQKEKKVSETATKGGYNDVSIDHLFNDPKGGDQNADRTDEDEHSEGGSNTSKEELAKVSKGLPQHDFDVPPTFFATKPSSRLGLVLHKAESEGRDYQSKISRSQIAQKEGLGMDYFVKRQDELGTKRREEDQFREIKTELEAKIKERDNLVQQRLKSMLEEGRDKHRHKKDRQAGVVSRGK